MKISATKTFQSLYKKLNREQRAAVDAIEGPVMVLAGPGTGKTQILTMRIAHILLSTQMDPWNILCLTFTESGVAAMKNRLLTIIGEAAYKVRIHTFHSFCNEIIHEHPDTFAPHLVLGSAPSVTEADVLSDIERVQLFRRLIEQLPPASALRPFGSPYLYLPNLIKNVQSLKQEGITPQQYGQVMKKIEQFISATEKVVTDFLALPLKERSSTTITQLKQTLQKIRSRKKLPDSIWLAGEKLFVGYEEDIKNNLKGKEESKRTTKFKNDLKRWYTALREQLPKQKALEQVYEAYQVELRKMARYDYEDMIMAVVEQFKVNDKLLAQYQEQFQYILVDEYQDTNGAQNETLRLLGTFSPRPNIFVVGDDKQSIYRFQGASLENLLYFYDLYKEYLTIIALKENYRSQQRILDAASALISRNTESVVKYVPHTSSSLTAAHPRKTSPLHVYALPSEDAENYFVATKVQELLNAGVDPAEIAVLYRYNRDGRDLLDSMLRLALPVRLETGENVLDDRRVHQWVELLTYLTHPEREDILAAILQYDFFGLDPLDALRVVNHAAHRKLGILNVLADTEELAAAKVQYPDRLLLKARQLAEWRAKSVNCVLPECFDTILRESGYLAYLTENEGEIPSLNKLNTLFTEAKRLAAGNAHTTLKDFIDHLSLLEEHGIPLMAEPLYTAQHAVRLMTAHKAKGLEFEHVFVIRVVDRHWGNIREWNRIPLPQGLVRHDTIAAQENNEDERRLFYVALTRAKQQIYLTYALHDALMRDKVPSAFLAELPAELTERHVVEGTPEIARTRWQQLTIPAKPVPVTIRDWVTQLFSRYAMSVTHLNTYLECPRKFYYHHLLRFPRAKNKHMAFGTAVHRSLREFFVTWQRTGKLPPADFLTGRFQEYLQHEALNEADRAECLTIAHTTLPLYYQEYHRTFISDALLEYDFRSHTVTLEGLVLTGQIDKVEILDKQRKTVNVVDYKTGNPDTKAKALRPGGDYYRQLVFYKLLCDLSPQFPYTMVSGEIDFLQPSARTGKHIKKRLEITAAETDELTKIIKKVWQDIKAMKFLEPDVGCGECEYCVAVKTHGVL